MAFTEWAGVCAQLARHTESKAGRLAAQAMTPSCEAAEVRALQDTTREAQALLARDACCEMRSLSDLVDLYARASEQGRPLSARELVGVAQTIRLGDRAAEAFASSPRLSALVAREAEVVSVQTELADLIEASVGPYGQVLDTASELLGRLRSEIASQRVSLDAELSQLCQNGSLMLALVQHRPVEREGTPCLLVKQGELGRVPGPIVDRQPEGFYVHPDALAGSYNVLRDLLIAAEEEALRISDALSARAMGLRVDLERLAAGLIAADLHQAMARYGQDAEGVLVEASEDASLLLRGALHPILARQGECVPLDLELGSDSRLLMISGPNGGGKTAAMKTLGLTALLTQCGCPVPVQSGRLPVYRAFACVAEARSSVGAGVSTFQAHARDLAAALEGARPGALVLLDEIGVGTDPGEAAALAQAFLELLLERELRILATTHLGPLKRFAQEEPRCQNAAVSLDGEGRPTFALLLGQSGRSYALEVVRQAGLPDSLIQRAAELHRGEG
ncbi:MAG TPA: hypothetical protein DEA08_28300 [Planctomycetes bacterium]|nr:hypothetical protein [Planctomycetota bacterium]